MKDTTQVTSPELPQSQLETRKRGKFTLLLLLILGTLILGGSIALLLHFSHFLGRILPMFRQSSTGQLPTPIPNPCQIYTPGQDVPCVIVITFDYQKVKKQTPELTEEFVKQLLDESGYNISIKQIIVKEGNPIQAIINTEFQHEEEIAGLLKQKFSEYIVIQNKIKFSQPPTE